MDINRLTDKSQEALRQAQTLASRRNHQGVDVEHLFSALLEPADGIVTTLLAQTGVPVAAVKKALDQELDRIPQVTGAGAAAGPDQAYVTQRLSRLFTRAEDEARASRTTTSASSTCCWPFSKKGARQARSSAPRE